MGDNFHGLLPDPTEEADEQDDLKAKLDLITITSAKNLETMQSAINVNTTENTTQFAYWDMETGTTSTLRTYVEANRALITTNTTNINNLDTPLTTDCIKFNINGGYAIDGSGNITGSLLSITNHLTTTHRRYVLVRTDTYSSDITLSDSNTKFSPSETGNYLSIISYEIYDNSTATKTVELELWGDTENSLQMARQTFSGKHSSFEYNRVSNTMVVYLTAGRTYYYRAKSDNGGVINAFSTVTNLTLIKLNKTF
jgi:hypothetical protein